ncbi:MAG: DUF4363 family protein [Clostridia bacterium]
MKQIIILIVSLGLLVFSGIWEVSYLDKTSQYVLSDVEYSKNALLNGDFELAKEHIKEIENSWNNTKTIWNIFITHDEIDKIEEQIVKYRTYIDEKNREEAIVASDLLQRDLRHIVEKQRLDIGNVL